MNRLLRITHASGKFNTGDQRYRRGLRTIYERCDSDAYTHTEANGDQVQMIRAIADEFGMGPVIDLAGGGIVVLSRDFKRVTGSFAGAVPANRTAAKYGGHGPRGILTGEGTWHGERIAISTWHGIAGSLNNRVWMGQTIKMVNVLADVIRRNSQGRDLAFWTADTNVDDDDRLAGRFLRVLHQHGLVSCWEELGREIPTHGRRTIDWVGSAKRDARVSLEDVKVWPKVEGFDHSQVTATYEIRGARK